MRREAIERMIYSILDIPLMHMLPTLKWYPDPYFYSYYTLPPPPPYLLLTDTQPTRTPLTPRRRWTRRTSPPRPILALRSFPFQEILP